VVCTPPIIVIRESGLTIIELELELKLKSQIYKIRKNIAEIFRCYEKGYG